MHPSGITEEQLRGIEEDLLKEERELAQRAEAVNSALAELRSKIAATQAFRGMMFPAKPDALGKPGTVTSSSNGQAEDFSTMSGVKAARIVLREKPGLTPRQLLEELTKRGKVFQRENQINSIYSLLHKYPTTFRNRGGKWSLREEEERAT